MAMDPSIAAQAEAAARRSEEAAETFFRAAPSLCDHDRVAASVADFVARHSAGSGGAGGPARGDLHHLRRHHGAPGAALRALHRQFRLRPARGGRHRNCLWQNAGIFSRRAMLSSSSIDVPQSHSAVVKAAISNYRKLLQIVSTSMSCLAQRGMFFLAAAVSDFYVPWESMAKHKIESAVGPLNMQLNQVPKMLFILRNNWAPSAFCVSSPLFCLIFGTEQLALKSSFNNHTASNSLGWRIMMMSTEVRKGLYSVLQNSCNMNRCSGIEHSGKRSPNPHSF